MDTQSTHHRRHPHRSHNRLMLAALGAPGLVLILTSVIVTSQFGSDDAITVTQRGDSLSMSSDWNGSRLSIEATTRNPATNGGFNLLRTTLGGSLIHNTGDDVAPIRTQMGTVGGNHGFGMVAGFSNPDHKSEADLGSVWTDGSREYVLLAIAKGGTLIMGGDYVRSDGEVTSKPVGPSRALTHVSGAVHRGNVLADGLAAQLYPSTARRVITTSCDGVIVDGNARCREVDVRESYDVLDYADLYEKAKSHSGQSYEKLSIDGMVHVENTYRFAANGRALVRAEVTALVPVALGETGLLQSKPLTGGAGEIVVRQLPGLRPIDGYDFRRGVDLSRYTQDERVTSGDLLRRAAPPTFSLDRIISRRGTRAGFAFGYIPTGSHAGSQTARSAAASTKLWDLRSTRKSYPVALTGRRLQEGDRIEVEGFRTYLTPRQADQLSAAVVADRPTEFTLLWS